jgi:hypothetical protein
LEAGIFKMLITFNNLEKNENVVISMPKKIFSKDGDATMNYS